MDSELGQQNVDTHPDAPTRMSVNRGQDVDEP